MEQETSSTSDGEPKRNRHGGDRFTPQAKATRPGVRSRSSLCACAGTLSAPSRKPSVLPKPQRKSSFMGALGRNANQDLETYHRTELAALDLQEAEIWRILDAVENQNKARLVMSCHYQLNRIHVRRARLLGLDAPKTLNVEAIYNKERQRTKSRSIS